MATAVQYDGAPLDGAAPDVPRAVLRRPPRGSVVEIVKTGQIDAAGVRHGADGGSRCARCARALVGDATATATEEGGAATTTTSRATGAATTPIEGGAVIEHRLRRRDRSRSRDDGDRDRDRSRRDARGSGAAEIEIGRAIAAAANGAGAAT